MSMVTSRMVIFKEYTSYRFTDPENPKSLTGVKDPQPETGETAPVDVQNKWVYVVRYSRYTPGDGISTYINEIKVQPGRAYPLPVHEQSENSPCWSFFCLSPIKLSLPRQEILRKQVHAITQRQHTLATPQDASTNDNTPRIPSVVTENIPEDAKKRLFPPATARCDRLVLLPLNEDQQKRLQGRWLSTFAQAQDVEMHDEPGNHVTTVYLHDYVTALKQAGNDFTNGEQEYEAFMNRNDSNFPRLHNLKHRESITLGSLTYSICGNNETYHRNLAYSNFLQWYETTIEEHLKREMPFKAAAQRALALLMTRGLHAALIDYEYADNLTQRNEVESIIINLLEQFADSPEVITCIGSLIEKAYKAVDEKLKVLTKEDLSLEDLTKDGNESNWWETYIANPESPVNRGVLPASEAAAQILELASLALATIPKSEVVVEFIIKNRFQKNSAGVPFRTGDVVLHSGKQYTSERELSKLFETVFPKGTDNQRLTVQTNDGSVGRKRHYTVRRQMTTVRKTRGQVVGAVAQGLDRALIMYGIASSAYAFAKANNSNERLTAILGYAKGLADLYTAFVPKAASIAGQTAIVFAKSISGCITIAMAVNDYQQKGYEADILWRQGQYERAAARRFQRDINILVIGGGVASLYALKSALIVGGIASNAVPAAGQIASLILLALAAVLSVGVFVWEHWIHRDVLERWLANCIPWGNNFSGVMSDKLPWTQFIAYYYKHNGFPISLASTNFVVNNYPAIHSAFNDITINILFRSAEYRERYDRTPGFFRRATYIPYQILQLTIATNSPIDSSHNHFRLTAMLHNRYHYVELNIPEQLDLFEEYYCSRAYDAQTGQTLYFLGWIDSTVANRSSKKQEAAQSYAQHNMSWFDAQWGYSKITDEKVERPEALKQLNLTLKEDLMLQEGLTDMIHLLTGSNLIRREVFLRIALELSDGSDIAVRRMADIPISCDMTFRTSFNLRDYERSLPRRPPERPNLLPAWYRGNSKYTIIS